MQQLRMHSIRTRREGNSGIWPRKVRHGRVEVTIYKRRTPTGGTGYLVANYASGKRRLDAYRNESEAVEAATKLARQLSEREVLAASMTNEQAAEYSAAVLSLAPFNVSLINAASTLAECLNLIGDLPSLHAAATFYAARNRKITKKPVAEVVEDLLALKESRGASPRYLQDLRSRLGKIATAFKKAACEVTTSDLQNWLDSLNLRPQTYTNLRRIANLLFQYAVNRGHAAENPVEGVEKVKIASGEIEIYTPEEIGRLLEHSPDEYRCCIAIGAFAGLRSAEIERIRWEDIDLKSRHIVVGANRAKTATRRVVPITENLAAWLAGHETQKGLVWKGSHRAFYEAQEKTAAASGIQWKGNALRHSYASYSFAQTNDAGRVAGNLGNSAGIVHRHYRELVKPQVAEQWFSVAP